MFITKCTICTYFIYFYHYYKMNTTASFNVNPTQTSTIYVEKLVSETDEFVVKNDGNNSTIYNNTLIKYLINRDLILNIPESFP